MSEYVVYSSVGHVRAFVAAVRAIVKRRPKCVETVKGAVAAAAQGPKTTTTKKGGGAAAARGHTRRFAWTDCSRLGRSSDSDKRKRHRLVENVGMPPFTDAWPRGLLSLAALSRLVGWGSDGGRRASARLATYLVLRVPTYRLRNDGFEQPHDVMLHSRGKKKYYSVKNRCVNVSLYVCMAWYLTAACLASPYRAYMASARRLPVSPSPSIRYALRSSTHPPALHPGNCGPIWAATVETGAGLVTCPIVWKFALYAIPAIIQRLV